MAIPFTPPNFYIQQGNNEVYLSWDLVAGATSYTVKVSTDGITYTTLASPTTNSYTDSAVTLGTQYWYQVASTNGSGTSTYTDPQNITPAPNGEMSLSELRMRSQQRADRLNSDFVTTSEWNSNINQSMLELYDLLVTVYEDYFMAPALSFQTDGTSNLFALPNGTNYDAAPAFYKMLGLDIQISNGGNGWASVKKFNFADRNQFFYPTTNGTMYGMFNMRYRLMGDKLDVTPVPSANQTLRLWYVPRLEALLADNSLTTIGFSGWLEYVIVDAAIKALQKEESDVTVLAAQKMALIKRIEDSAMNRDIGQPDTVTNSRNDFQNPYDFMKGGW